MTEKTVRPFYNTIGYKEGLPRRISCRGNAIKFTGAVLDTVHHSLEVNLLVVLIVNGSIPKNFPPTFQGVNTFFRTDMKTETPSNTGLADVKFIIPAAAFTFIETGIVVCTHHSLL
jgi:hypothetical protein